MEYQDVFERIREVNDAVNKHRLVESDDRSPFTDEVLESLVTIEQYVRSIGALERFSDKMVIIDEYGDSDYVNTWEVLGDILTMAGPCSTLGFILSNRPRMSPARFLRILRMIYPPFRSFEGGEYQLRVH